MGKRVMTAVVALMLTMMLTLREVTAVSEYVAAVVEHEVYMGSTGQETPQELLQVNLDLYVNLTSLAMSKNAQILVFPEFGLTATAGKVRSDLYPFAERIPDVTSTTYDLPCTDPAFANRPILRTMSCAAKTHRVPLLINTIDWVDCTSATDASCPDDQHYQYNTNVVFNEHGQLVAKYHKSHEFTPFIGIYDQVPSPTQVTYQSSFGVEFGIFTCFDIMFPDPAKRLREEGIQHFLYPVAQGELGEKTLIEGWSHQNDAVLLSANLATDKVHDCSGIINRGNVLDAQKYHLMMGDFHKENILVATVPV